MKREYKWIIYLNVDTKTLKQADCAISQAQDAFFDSLNSDEIEWEVIDEELK